MGYWSKKFHETPAPKDIHDVDIIPAEEVILEGDWQHGIPKLSLAHLLRQMKSHVLPREYTDAIESAVLDLERARQRDSNMKANEAKTALFNAFETCLTLPKDVLKLPTRKAIREAVDAIDHAAIRMAAESQARGR